MKKPNYIKEVYLYITFVTAIFLLTSFNNKNNLLSSKIDVEKINNNFLNEVKNSKSENDNRKIDSAFLVKASEINLNEIQLGQLAYQKGKTYHVRQLGELIKIGHSQSQRDLTTLAKSKKISLPTSPSNDSNDAYDNLSNKSDDDFDKAYVNMTLNAHKEAIESFKIASEECTDKEIKAWAKSILPILQKHLDYAIESQFKFE